MTLSALEVEQHDKAKFQNTVWWITSIAVSVVCCSVLFILFASYLVDIKNDLRDDSVRIAAMEQRQSRMMTEVELMSKRLAAQSPAATSMAPPAAATAPAGITLSPSTAAPDSATAPVSPSDTVAPTTQPTISVPSIAAPAKPQ